MSKTKAGKRPVLGVQWPGHQNGNELQQRPAHRHAEPTDADHVHQDRGCPARRGPPTESRSRPPSAPPHRPATRSRQRNSSWSTRERLPPIIAIPHVLRTEHRAGSRKRTRWRPPVPAQLCHRRHGHRSSIGEPTIAGPCRGLFARPQRRCRLSLVLLATTLVGGTAMPAQASDGSRITGEPREL